MIISFYGSVKLTDLNVTSYHKPDADTVCQFLSFLSVHTYLIKWVPCYDQFKGQIKNQIMFEEDTLATYGTLCIQMYSHFSTILGGRNIMTKLY